MCFLFKRIVYSSVPSFFDLRTFWRKHSNCSTHCMYSVRWFYFAVWSFIFFSFFSSHWEKYMLFLLWSLNFILSVMVTHKYIHSSTQISPLILVSMLFFFSPISIAHAMYAIYSVLSTLLLSLMYSQHTTQYIYNRFYLSTNKHWFWLCTDWTKPKPKKNRTNFMLTISLCVLTLSCTGFFQLK